MLMFTSAIVGIGTTITNAKSIVPRSSFFILLPPVSVSKQFRISPKKVAYCAHRLGPISPPVSVLRFERSLDALTLLLVYIFRNGWSCSGWGNPGKSAGCSIAGSRQASWYFRKIKADPGLQSIPVAVWTTSEESEERIQCLDAGAGLLPATGDGEQYEVHPYFAGYCVSLGLLNSLLSWRMHFIQLLKRVGAHLLNLRTLFS